MKKIESLKRKIIYRSNYRGTKEMDMLLQKFVNKYINELNQKELEDLHNFLNLEDEEIYNFYNGKPLNKELEKKNICKLFQNLRFYKMAERVGSNPRTVALLLVFKTSAFNRSATSPFLLLYKLINLC